MKRGFQALIPREHGSWAFILSPQIAALVAAQNPMGAIPIAGAAVVLFLAFHLVVPARSKRLAAVEASGIVAAGALGAVTFLAGGREFPGAILLAVASITYFLLSLIWVRMRLATETDDRQPLLPSGWNTLASLILLLLSGTVGVLTGRLVAGLLPGLYLLRSFFPVPRRPNGRIRMSSFGVQEAIAASLFTIGLGLYLPE